MGWLDAAEMTLRIEARRIGWDIRKVEASANGRSRYLKFRDAEKNIKWVRLSDHWAKYTPSILMSEPEKLKDFIQQMQPGREPTQPAPFERRMLATAADIARPQRVHRSDLPPVAVGETDLYRKDQAADRLGIKPGTLRDWVKRGWLKAPERIGGTTYYEREAVELAAAQHTTGSKTQKDSS